MQGVFFYVIYSWNRYWGGTYTDGVIVDSMSRKIVCKAKTLTTKDDLTVGIKNCIDKLDFEKMSGICLVSISTTLATNAIIEGRGGKVALIYMGAEMDEKIPTTMCFKVKGGIDIMGRTVEDIDKKEIEEVLMSLEGKVDAIAISEYASVRNQEHEKEIKATAH